MIPVHPIKDMNDHPGPIGITLRDHFAGLAMQGICASGPTILNEAIALEAFAIADAMLAERDK
jgi:hypothetical protein